MGPIVLGANQPPRFYRGGSRIAAFRGEAALRDDVPEDWVGSTTTVFGRDELGITRLPDGQPLDTIDTASLVRRNILDGNGNGRDLLPSDANAFFGAQLHGPGSSTHDAGYSIAIVTSGEGQLASRQSSVPIRRGMTLIVPHEAGKLELTGDVQVLLCRPPLN